jgi:hypothetical protein
VSLSDELKERNILKLILIVRFACVRLDVGHPIYFLVKAMKKPTDHRFCFRELREWIRKELRSISSILFRFRKK